VPVSHSSRAFRKEDVMVLLQSFVSVLYWVLVLYVSGLLVWNLVRSRKWEEEILLVIVLVPFLLRLFRLK
jgi:hypothetical protein